jgi:hypothetical protein
VAAHGLLEDDLPDPRFSHLSTREKKLVGDVLGTQDTPTRLLHSWKGLDLD